VVNVVQMCAAAFGLLFVGAALGKLDSWHSWVEAVARLPLSQPLQRPVSVLLPLCEAGLGVLVVTAPAAGLAAAAALLAFFGVAVMALRKVLAGQECNCFGATMRMEIGSKLALRNFALSALAVVASVLAARLDVRALTGIELVATLLAGLVAMMLGELARMRRAERELLGRPA
jgi:Methylamine utilisation protein MauE